jgi:hypothetical protein
MLTERTPAEFAKMVVENWDKWAPKGLAGSNIEVYRLALAYLATQSETIDENAAPQVPAATGRNEGQSPATGPDLVDTPAVAAPTACGRCCQWRGPGPEPAKWSCCGVVHYRSRADAVDD